MSYKKEVKDLKTGETYPSTAEAARQTGLTRQAVSLQCLGDVLAKSQRFQYVEEPITGRTRKYPRVLDTRENVLYDNLNIASKRTQLTRNKIKTSKRFKLINDGI